MSSYTRLNGGSTGKKKKRSLTVRKAPRSAFMLTIPTKNSCHKLVKSRNFNYNRPVIQRMKSQATFLDSQWKPNVA